MLWPNRNSAPSERSSSSPSAQENPRLPSEYFTVSSVSARMPAKACIRLSSIPTSRSSERHRDRLREGI